MQIIQFFIDTGIINYAAYSRYASQYRPSLPHAGDCSGTVEAMAFGALMIDSYLVLFINFFIQTYKKKGKVHKGDAKMKAKVPGVTNGDAVTNGKAH